ncbi:MAG: pyridoxal phosphate-dependent aminotransferase [Solirubrobacterales bacterium]
MYFKIKKNIKTFEPKSYVKEEPCSSLNSLIDCSLGVNPFGHSDKINSSLEKINLSSYPDFPYSELKNEIIKYWNCSHIAHSNIRFGGGSIDILRNINKAFIEKNTKVLGCAPTFTSYPSDVLLNEGIFDYVPLSENTNYKFDAEKFISLINDKYSLIYIDNPNNPTGQIIPLDEIRQIAEKARENNVCLFVDEAYGDFMDEKNSAINLTDSFENIMVSRTFSKGFGLAGLRIGYLIAGNYLTETISKVDIPFTINSLGTFAAIEALKDKSFILESRTNIGKIKKALMNSFKNLKVLETNLEVPIMTLTTLDPKIHLYKLFYINGVLTESGEDFNGLQKNFIRMRVPKDPTELMNRINSVEKQLA